MRYKHHNGYTERENGQKISVNAFHAEECGKYTEGRFRVVYKVGKKEFEVFKVLGIIRTTEWHHTGANFKKNDFYEWKDCSCVDYDEGRIPAECVARDYYSHKAEIVALCKDYDQKTLMWKSLRHIVNVPTIEEFKEKYIELHESDLLTSEQIAKKYRAHDVISNEGPSDSYERYCLHKAVDKGWANVAASQASDELIQSECQKKWANIIAENVVREKENAEIVAYNMATDGKEAVIYKIGKIMGMEESEIVEKIRTYVLECRFEERGKMREEIRDRYASLIAEVKAETEKKQREYVKKLLADGRAKNLFRISESERPEYFITEQEEQNGKYGWFKNTGRYPLPVYYTGIAFGDKRTFNHYNKIGHSADDRIISLCHAENEEINSLSTL